MTITALTPTDPSNLKGLSILITGGASGLGKHAATLFAQSGAIVTIADIQDGSAIATDLTDQGHKAQFVQCDITNWDSQVKAFQAALTFSPTKTIDAVAAFAGIFRSGHLVDQISAAEVSLDGPAPPPPSLDHIEVNLKGSYYTSALALHYFRLKPTGDADVGAISRSKSLTIVSSLAGYLDETHSTAYTSSKFGSRGLFRAIREKAHTRMNVRVNLIAPWTMKTPMIEADLLKLAEYGIVEGRGITLVPHSVLSEALGRIVVDEGIYGRAFAIVPEGAVDLGDDLQGAYGGPALAEILALRKAAGDMQQS
ncbi:hypothetical protein BJY04DRAFT_201388 [Aspergillus karnatakaensis]|uniref:uncharacterized protein n=1 Tax=Aspergillus karnatakaensis TaxID=1810916 RepID=UPI003CCDFD25